MTPPTNKFVSTLFCDVDGCLNHFPSRTHSCLPLAEDSIQDALEEDKLTLLGRVYDETECRIVLTSYWRIWPYKLTHLYRTFGQHGLVIHSHTPVMETTYPGCKIVRACPRFEEIQAWLNEHPETGNFVILDDEMDFSHLESHHVRPMSTEGLTKQIAEEIIRRLNKPQS